MRLLMQAVSWFEEAHEKAYIRGIDNSQMIYLCNIDTTLIFVPRQDKQQFDDINSTKVKYWGAQICNLFVGKKNYEREGG